jgi:hypothetical protein
MGATFYPLKNYSRDIFTRKAIRFSAPYWKYFMLTVLSLMDERLRPKGSRDPLGIETIWSHMGRKVVGNLTTVTSNLDNFMVSLLCCAYANTATDKLEQIQTNFMCAEQLAGYLRLTEGNESFLGITRAKANLYKDKFSLGKNESSQILSNQLSYGLWGLYFTAMQVAGLVSGAERRLTDKGQNLVAQIVNVLGAEHWQLFNTFAQRSQLSKSHIAPLATEFNRMLRDSNLRQLVVEALLNWHSANPLQLELYTKAIQYLTKFKGELEIPLFCKWLIESQDASPALRSTIEQIQSLEPLLKLAITLLSWLQGEKDKTRMDLAATLNSRLSGLSLIDTWNQNQKLPHRMFLTRLVEAANAHNANELINCVIEQNKQIMKERGGAAWIEWQGEILKVRVSNDRASLPESLNSHCNGKWWNTYFLGSFLQIARQAVK